MIVHRCQHAFISTQVVHAGLHIYRQTSISGTLYMTNLRESCNQLIIRFFGFQYYFVWCASLFVYIRLMCVCKAPLQLKVTFQAACTCNVLRCTWLNMHHSEALPTTAAACCRILRLADLSYACRVCYTTFSKWLHILVHVCCHVVAAKRD